MLDGHIYRLLSAKGGRIEEGSLGLPGLHSPQFAFNPASLSLASSISAISGLASFHRLSYF